MRVVLPRALAESRISGYERELLLEMFRRMTLIRLFERRTNELFLRGLMPGTIHLSDGQEATAVGTCLALARNDVVTLTHRGHGQALAKGVEVVVATPGRLKDLLLRGTAAFAVGHPEKLVDFEDYFRRWRFNHVTTVERIIGLKRGTGGTAGVSYLRRMLEVELFPELWKLRTEL